MDRFPHYIKRNEITRIPRRHIFLDVEANERKVKTGKEQFWRLAVARLWTNDKGRREHEETKTFDDPGDLWRTVSGWAKPRCRTVLWAHNLGYDVRVSESLVTLPDLGWSLIAHNLSGRGTWLTWRKDDATLVFVDSASVFPTTLAEVGKHFGLHKPDLPAFEDGREDWQARCLADVEILSTAVKAYLRKIDDEDLGNWQTTGSGQSWATFRHRFMSDKILVHDDETALRAERRAMWTGRCEAFWHGSISFAVVHEWDLTLAYARIARDIAVPTRLVGPLSNLDTWRRYLDHPKAALLAEVEITTDVPVVPTEVDGHIAWPVGTFRTTLWSNELKAAADAGATITVLGGWLYRTEYALRDWADWIIQTLEDDSGTVPAWWKLILKHWARALIGRFAMTYTTWEPFGQHPRSALQRSMYIDAQTGKEGELLQIGRDVFEKSAVQEWQHSVPAITGYIMAECRVRLWKIITALPPEAVIYADTDSILATDQWHDAVKEVAESPVGQGLRLKRSWDGISIWGPRQVVTGNVVRVAGLPKRARRTGRHTFDGEVWESLDAATKRGRFSRVHIAPRTWQMKGIDRRRDGPSVGWTTPHRVMRE
jgi:hypothetical protein